MTSLKTKFNAEDRTLTYWSVYQQRWVRAISVPDRELAAMSPEERDEVRAFLKGEVRS